MTVLTPSNAFPGGAFPQHGSGQTATVTSYIYPGAVQPLSTTPTKTSYTNAFPGRAFLQHLAGQTTTVQSYIYPGAVQPIVAAAPVASPEEDLIPMTGAGIMIRPGLLVAGNALAALLRNRVQSRRRFLSLIGWNKEED